MVTGQSRNFIIFGGRKPLIRYKNKLIAGTTNLEIILGLKAVLTYIFVIVLVKSPVRVTRWRTILDLILPMKVSLGNEKSFG